MDYKCPNCKHEFRNVDYQPGMRCWFCGHKEDGILPAKFEVHISREDILRSGYAVKDQRELDEIVEKFEQIFQEDYFYTISKATVNEWLFDKILGE